MSSSTLVSAVIRAPRETVYRAFLDRDAFAAWLPPGEMTGEVHAFEAREGGLIHMSLFYPEDGPEARGKTSAKTDTFRARVAKLVPNERIVWAVGFESEDPSFGGVMTVDWTLADAGEDTKVSVLCENIPPGIDPRDNEAGCRSTLEKLAAFAAG